jgi:hypothetical protein
LIRLPTPWINFTDFHPPYRNIAANIESGEGGIRMIFIRGISDKLSIDVGAGHPNQDWLSVVTHP